ncbi:MAG: response regulator [Nitrospinota bacterium]
MNKPFEELTALVVDDYENMRKKLSTELASLGLSVVEAANGIEAIKILRGELAGKIDVVFTDIVMPEMDGFELCEEVRKKPDLRGLPIVVSSTHVDASYVVRALRLGADDYIVKPVKSELVKKVLTRIMTPMDVGEKDG